MTDFQGGGPNESSSLWTDAVYGQSFSQTRYPTYSDGVHPVSAGAKMSEGNDLLRLASQEVRMGFIRKVYGILIFMLVVSLAVAMPFYLKGMAWDSRHIWLILVAVVLLIGTMCYMTCNPEAARQFPTSYFLVLIFALAMGVLVGYTVVLFTWQTFLLAVALTFVIVVALTVFAFTSASDFTGAAPYMLVALLMLILFGNTIVLLSVFGVDTNMLYLIYSFLGATLFSFFIVFDTQRMLGGTHKFQFHIDDYAMAALQLYLDIINLFTSLLGIMGERKM